MFRKMACKKSSGSIDSLWRINEQRWVLNLGLLTSGTKSCSGDNFCEPTSVGEIWVVHLM